MTTFYYFHNLLREKNYEIVKHYVSLVRKYNLSNNIFLLRNFEVSRQW